MLLPSGSIAGAKFGKNSECLVNITIITTTTVIRIRPKMHNIAAHLQVQSHFFTNNQTEIMIWINLLQYNETNDTNKMVYYSFTLD